MKTFNEIHRLPEFDKDIKKLLKKFRTLEEDFDIFVKTELMLYHKLKKDNKGIKSHIKRGCLPSESGRKRRVGSEDII